MGSFEQSVDEARSGGDFFKFKEGANRLRIMSEPVIKVFRFGYGICYEGAPYCQKATLDKELEEAKAQAKKDGKDPSKVAIKMPSKKWECWAIIRGDGKKIKDKFAIVDLPYGVSKELLTMMTSDEAGFKGWPMPYDINITAKNAGTFDVDYKVLASRTNSDVTDEEMAEYAKLTPINDILERMKDKKRKEVEGGTSSSTQDSDAIEYPSEDVNPDDIPF
jgi:hypothetical protein